MEYTHDNFITFKSLYNKVIFYINVLGILTFHVIVKSTLLYFSLKKGRSDMTSFLDIHYGYDVGVMQTIC